MYDITEEIQAFAESIMKKGLGAIVSKDNRMIRIELPYICPECDTKFVPKRKDQVWCSKKCGSRVRSRAWQRRKAEAAK